MSPKQLSPPGSNSGFLGYTVMTVSTMQEHYDWKARFYPKRYPKGNKSVTHKSFYNLLNGFSCMDYSITYSKTVIPAPMNFAFELQVKKTLAKEENLQTKQWMFLYVILITSDTNNTAEAFNVSFLWQQKSNIVFVPFVSNNSEFSNNRIWQHCFTIAIK